jgi:hypothetical protein
VRGPSPSAPKSPHALSGGFDYRMNERESFEEVIDRIGELMAQRRGFWPERRQQYSLGARGIDGEPGVLLDQPREQSRMLLAYDGAHE